MTRTASQQMFAHVVDRRDDDIPLDVAALLVADWQSPNLDVGHYLRALDRFGELARQIRQSGQQRPFAAIGALNGALFGELGFRGNEEDYYDPRNSFLHEVIERRTGIPISLSVVYVEVARRMGIRVEGVSFPGHFLVRYRELDRTLIIDPFRLGMILDDDALRQILQRVRGGRVTPEITPELLAPATHRQVLTRMLTNLAGIYSRRGELASALEVLERMLILEPDNRRIERDVARLRERVGELN